MRKVILSIILMFTSSNILSASTIYNERLRPIGHMEDKLNHRKSLVILWTTYCPECLESLKKIIQARPLLNKKGIEPIFINHDFQKDLEQAVKMAEALDVPFYYDLNNNISAKYKAENTDFWAGAFIEKKLKGELSDSHPYPVPIVEDLFRFPIATSQDPKINDPVDTKKNIPFSISGQGVSRIMNIHGDDDNITGFFNESMEKGVYFDYLFQPSLSYKINDQITLNCKMRLTNIDDLWLQGAPDHFTNSIFSPSITYQFHPKFRITAGYYQLALTPLTLYRWDSSNNPTVWGGSSGGCSACGGQSGVFSMKSLEFFDKHIGFEGANALLTLSPKHRVRVFYARPGEKDSFCSQYLEQLWGMEWMLNPISLRYLFHHENPGDCENIDYIPDLKPYRETSLASMGLNKDLSGFTFKGEFCYFFERKSYLKPQKYRKRNDGPAYLLSCAYDFNPFWFFKKFSLESAHYLIDEYYTPSFLESSYLVNSESQRYSWETLILNVSFNLFYQHVVPQEKQSADFSKINIVSLGLKQSFYFKKNSLYWSAYYLKRGAEKNQDSSITNSSDKDVFLTTLSYSPMKGHHIRLEFQTQKIKDQDVAEGKTNTNRAHTLSLYFISSF